MNNQQQHGNSAASSVAQSAAAAASASSRTNSQQQRSNPLPSFTEVHTSSPTAAGLPVLEVVRRLEEEKLISREDRAALKEGLYSEDPYRREEIVKALCEVELSMNGKFAVRRLKATIHQNGGGERSSRLQQQQQPLLQKMQQKDVFDANSSSSNQQQRQDAIFYAALMKKNGHSKVAVVSASSGIADNNNSSSSSELKSTSRRPKKEHHHRSGSYSSNNNSNDAVMTETQKLRSRSANLVGSGDSNSSDSDSSEDKLIAALKPRKLRAAESSAAPIDKMKTRPVALQLQQQDLQQQLEFAAVAVPSQRTTSSQIQQQQQKLETLSTISQPSPAQFSDNSSSSQRYQPKTHSDITHNYNNNNNNNINSSGNNKEQHFFNFDDGASTRTRASRNLSGRSSGRQQQQLQSGDRSISSSSQYQQQQQQQQQQQLVQLNLREHLLVNEFNTQSAISDVVGQSASYSGPENFNVLSKITQRLRDYLTTYGSPETNHKAAQRRFAVLVGGGSFNPLTRMHLRTFFLAKTFLESRHGFVVLGSLLSPAHGATVRERYRTNPSEIIPSPHRLAVAQLLVQNSKLLSVDPWEITRRRAMDYLSLLEHTNTMIKEQVVLSADAGSYNNSSSSSVGSMGIGGCEVKVMYVCKPNQVPKLSPQAMKAQGFGCVTVCRAHESDLLRGSLTRKWNGSIHVVEDTAILDASLDVVTSRKVRDKLKAGQPVGQLVGEKINDYMNAHRIGQKMCGLEKWEAYEKILPSLASRPAEPALRSQSTYSINKSKLDEHNKTMAQQQQEQMQQQQHIVAEDADVDVDRFGLAIQYEGPPVYQSRAAAPVVTAQYAASNQQQQQQQRYGQHKQTVASRRSDEMEEDEDDDEEEDQYSPSAMSKISSIPTQRSAYSSAQQSSQSVNSHRSNSNNSNSSYYTPSWASSERSAAAASGVGSVGGGVIGPYRGMLPAFEYDEDS